METENCNIIKLEQQKHSSEIVSHTLEAFYRAILLKSPRLLWRENTTLLDYRQLRLSRNITHKYSP